MISRIRDIRKQMNLTLADVAQRCVPPTTAQTVGRLETGMRNLSLIWMNRIAAALDVEPELLLSTGSDTRAHLVARLVDGGAEALSEPREAVLPSQLGGSQPLVVMEVEASGGDYRQGDQVWLRHYQPDDFGKLLNRDVLAPRPGGRFAFGRMIDRDAARIALLPPGPGKRQLVIDNPAWLGAAEMIVRRV